MNESTTPVSATLDDVVRELKLLRTTLASQSAELLDSHAAAKLLGLSRSSFFRLVALGKLPKPIKFGEQLRRWSRKALQAAIEENSLPPTSKK